MSHRPQSTKGLGSRYDGAKVRAKTGGYIETYVYSWLYRIVANMDGNFNWEQMKQSDTQLQNDVALHNGEGFMVESTRFAEHSRARMADKPPVLIITPLWELKQLTQSTEIHMLKPQGCQFINYL